jgi:hypothetical protein
VPSQPEELRRREARQGAIPRQLDEALGTDALLDLRALRRGPLVVPEDRGPDHAVSRIEHDEAVHLARETDACDLAACADLGEGR